MTNKTFQQVIEIRTMGGKKRRVINIIGIEQPAFLFSDCKAEWFKVYPECLTITVNKFTDIRDIDDLIFIENNEPLHK